MRGLFYRHRRWQKLNVLMLCVSILIAMFYHGVLNTLAVAVRQDNVASVQSIIEQSGVFALFSSNIFWQAQFSGFFSVFQQLSLWFDILWLPVSAALILVIEGLGTLLNRPRWQLSLLLLIMGIAFASLLPQVYDISGSARDTGDPALIGLYFSIAAAWVCGARLRGHHSH